jgi:hypothetical protein
LLKLRGGSGNTLYSILRIDRLKTSIFKYLATGLFFALGAAVFGFQAQEIPTPDYSQDCTSSGCHDEYGERDVIHDPVVTGFRGGRPRCPLRAITNEAAEKIKQQIMNEGFISE